MNKIKNCKCCQEKVLEELDKEGMQILEDPEIKKEEFGGELVNEDILEENLSSKSA